MCVSFYLRQTATSEKIKTTLGKSLSSSRPRLTIRYENAIVTTIHDDIISAVSRPCDNRRTAATRGQYTLFEIRNLDGGDRFS